MLGRAFVDTYGSAEAAVEGDNLDVTKPTLPKLTNQHQTTENDPIAKAVDATTSAGGLSLFQKLIGLGVIIGACVAFIRFHRPMQGKMRQ